MKVSTALVVAIIALQCTITALAEDPETCETSRDCEPPSDPFCFKSCLGGTCRMACQAMPAPECFKDEECAYKTQGDPYCFASCLRGTCLVACEMPQQNLPTELPSTSPTSHPSNAPSKVPADKPSAPPSAQPSALPSAKPTMLPTTTPIQIHAAQCVIDGDCAAMADGKPDCSAGCSRGKCVLSCLADAKDTPKSPCESNGDCNKGEYCASGKCLAGGLCRKEADCYNPSNDFLTISCNGFLKCEQGKCNKKCLDTGCPLFRPPAKCGKADPCDAKNCGQDFASCVPSRCGGCHGMFYDASGKRICWGKNAGKQQKCRKSSDCTAGQFCAGKTCIQNGTCRNKRDCLDSSNRYPKKTCPSKTSANSANKPVLGRLVCKQKRCETKC